MDAQLDRKKKLARQWVGSIDSLQKEPLKVDGESLCDRKNESDRWTESMFLGILVNEKDRQIKHEDDVVTIPKGKTTAWNLLLALIDGRGMVLKGSHFAKFISKRSDEYNAVKDVAIRTHICELRKWIGGLGLCCVNDREGGYWITDKQPISRRAKQRANAAEAVNRNRVAATQDE